MEFGPSATGARDPSRRVTGLLRGLITSRPGPARPGPDFGRKKRASRRRPLCTEQAEEAQRDDRGRARASGDSARARERAEQRPRSERARRAAHTTSNRLRARRPAAAHPFFFACAARRAGFFFAPSLHGARGHRRRVDSARSAGFAAVFEASRFGGHRRGPDYVAPQPWAGFSAKCLATRSCAS